AKSHGGVYIPGAGDVLKSQPECFSKEGLVAPVRHERGHIAAEDRRLAESMCEFLKSFDRSARRPFGLHDLDKLHSWDWVEEVTASRSFAMLKGGNDFANG